MLKKKIVMMAGAAVIVIGGGVGGFFALGLGGHAGAKADAPKPLTGADFGRMRREALDLFPRGSRIADAAAGLKALGFVCDPARHILADINAPSITCDSAGRGFPTASRLQVTVMARNENVSDIAIGNGFDSYRADARTPNPNPGGTAMLAGAKFANGPTDREKN